MVWLCFANRFIALALRWRWFVGLLLQGREEMRGSTARGINYLLQTNPSMSLPVRGRGAQPASYDLL